MVLLTSCKEDLKEDTSRIINETKTLLLEHKGLKLSSPITSHKVVGNDSLLVFDLKSLTLALFDLQKAQPVWSGQFGLDGPDFLDLPLFDIGIKGDTILVLSQQYLTLYSLEGQVLNRYDKEVFEGLNSSFELRNFELLHNTLIFPRIPIKVINPTAVTDSSTSIFYTFNLSSQKTRTLETDPPNEALLADPDQGYYHSFAEHQLTIGDQLWTYNFPFSSKIYQIQEENHQNKVYQAKSELTSNIREPLSRNHTLEELTEYFYSGSKFSKVHYDENTETFIRLHYEYGDTADGRKPLHKYLMVFDKNFVSRQEIRLSQEASVNMFVSNGKVYVFKSSAYADEENAFEIFVYAIRAISKP